ncbi:MAG: MepB family protein [Balneola sp.]
MNSIFEEVQRKVFKRCSFHISEYEQERESQEYEACKFELNGQFIISRKAKVTPKKRGQFVTFWKRNRSRVIEPYSEDDKADYFVVNIISEGRHGQFVFPKSLLVQKGIISSKKKEGKRAFRIYSPWDEVISSQAKKTRQWQIDYFYEIKEDMDVKKIIELYNAQ